MPTEAQRIKKKFKKNDKLPITVHSTKFPIFEAVSKQ